MANPTITSTEDLMQRVAELQQVQKRNRHTSASWKNASLALAPIFAELAARDERAGVDVAPRVDHVICG